MERKRINTLYSMLMRLDDRMIFEDYFTDMMNMGLVEVNGVKINAIDINMPVYLNDEITYKDTVWLVDENLLIEM